MIAEAIKRLHAELPKGVRLVAVSKFHDAQAVRQAYDAGQRLFGESRVKELLEKEAVLPDDIKWHFIGHLQTNKVRHIMGKTAMIESVDTERLLQLIDDESRRVGVVTRVLLQVHVAKEETKFGFAPEEIYGYFERRAFRQLTNTHLCGVMGMASNTDERSRVEADFRAIADVWRTVRRMCGDELQGFDTLSMGMSGDWPLAVEQGANLVRVGTAIFGPRQY